MGITFRTSAEDLLRCRFAISPLGETADALRSLARPAAVPGQIAAELDQVRATPPHRVAAELDRWQDRNPAAAAVLGEYPDLAGEPAQARDLLAGMLQRAWQSLIEPWWPRMRDILDADLTVRARQLAQAGLAATFNDLHPDIAYRDGTLRFALSASDELDVTGAAARADTQRVRLARCRRQLRPAGHQLSRARDRRLVAATRPHGG